MCFSSWYKKWEEKVLGCLRGSLFHKNGTCCTEKIEAAWHSQSFIHGTCSWWCTLTSMLPLEERKVETEKGKTPMAKWEEN